MQRQQRCVMRGLRKNMGANISAQWADGGLVAEDDSDAVYACLKGGCELGGSC